LRKKSKFSAADEQNEEVTLQITSMADIFTIILVFLLKSYSAGIANVSASQGVMLPEAKGQANYRDALKIEILKDSVLVDQKSEVNLKNYVFPADSDGVTRALLKFRKHLKAGTEDSHLLLLADQHTPYATLKKVMDSAASAGYVDLQLAVVQAD